MVNIFNSYLSNILTAITLIIFFFLKRRMKTLKTLMTWSFLHCNFRCFWTMTRRCYNFRCFWKVNYFFGMYFRILMLMKMACDMFRRNYCLNFCYK